VDEHRRPAAALRARRGCCLSLDLREQHQHLRARPP
jgi:hypothetical protein